MRKLILLIVLLYSPSAFAVLPPRIARQRRARLYKTARALQKTAPEVLVIRVLRVKTKRHYASVRPGSKRRKTLKGMDLTVVARVERVVRSQRRLRRGRQVKFSYSLRFQYQPGPRLYNPRGLGKGQRARVYLRYDAKRSPRLGRYLLGASVLSVVPLPSTPRK